ncbi:MAG TPA: hypothetical protein VLF16_01735 [Pseudomonas sp.]|nr:hypothetical protein [Pseudomonas sp.]
MQRKPERRTEELLGVLQDNLQRIDQMVASTSSGLIGWVR